MERIAIEERNYYALVKKVFALLAPVYDVVALPLTRVRDLVVDVADARPGSMLLDVATGTGTQALAFAKRGYEVIGVDLSEAMLQVARRKNHIGNVTFATGDATRLQFETSRFEATCVSFALHDMPLTIRAKVLKEMVRVTKPNGTIVIVDYALPDHRVWGFLVYQLVKLYEGEYYREFIHSDLKALLDQTGIEIKREVPILFGAGRILKGVNRK